MDALVSKPDHGDALIEKFNEQLVASQRLQVFFDDIADKINELGGGDTGTITPESFLPSSIIYRPSVGTDILAAVIDPNEFLGRGPTGEIQGLDFVESWAILGNGTDDIRLNATGGSKSFTVESNTSSTMFRVDGPNNRVGIAQGGFTPNDGTLHILNSTAEGGAVTADLDGNELVLEHNFDGGMTILNGSNSFGNIFFGSPAYDNRAGNIWFLHDTDFTLPRLGFDVREKTYLTMYDTIGSFFNENQDADIDFQINTQNVAPFLQVDSSGDRIGITDAGFAPTKGLIHIIQNAPAGSATPASFGNAIVIESNQSNGITLITIDSLQNSINFGNHVNPIFARFMYDHNFTNVNQGFKWFFSVVECLQLLPSFGFDWNPNQNDLMDFRIRGFGLNSSAIMFVDANAKRTGFSNTNVIPRHGVVQITATAIAGAVDAATNGSVLVVEGNGNTGMSILGNNNHVGSIYFGAPSGNDNGVYRFNHNSFSFEWFNQTVNTLTLGPAEFVVNPLGVTNMDFRAEGDTSTHLLFTDSSLGIVGISRTSLAPVHGALHIQQADAGVIAPLVTADLLVLEGTGEIGMSFLVDNATGFANLNFGDPSNGAAAGQIRYDANAAAWFFASTGTEMMRFNPTLGIVVNETGAAVHDFRVESVGSANMLFIDSGNNRVGIADNGFAPSDGLLHLFRGGAAGVVAASVLADSIVIESNAATGLSILVPNDGTAANIFLGAPTSGNSGGQIIYIPFTGLMTFSTSALPGIRIDTDQNILLGTIGAAATSAAGALHIPNDTSPTAVLANAIVLGSKDSGAGGSLAVPELWIEEPPEVIGTFTPSHKFKVWINGTEYFIQLDAV
jgi:hypothetical protein